MTKRKWRMFPKIDYHHWKDDGVCWKRWFYISRLWSGRLIFIGVKRHQICLDFRYNWLADMMSDRESQP
jgi:hypothetical protein